MAGAACKVIINNVNAAAIAATEEVLLSPLVRNVMLDAGKCDIYIQRLADLDIAMYSGDYSRAPDGGLRGILRDLQNHGVFTEEIWEVLAPGFYTTPVADS